MPRERSYNRKNLPTGEQTKNTHDFHDRYNRYYLPTAKLRKKPISITDDVHNKANSLKRHIAHDRKNKWVPSRAL